MKSMKPSSVRIRPQGFEKPLLEDVVQALHHVECIMAVNDDGSIEPGHLCGMSLMLANAERVLAEARSALPPARTSPRPPTSGSTAWPGFGRAYTLSN